MLFLTWWSKNSLMFDVNVMQRRRSNLIICFVIRELGLAWLVQGPGDIWGLTNLLHINVKLYVLKSINFVLLSSCNSTFYIYRRLSSTKVTFKSRHLTATDKTIKHTSWVSSEQRQMPICVTCFFDARNVNSSYAQ